MPNKLNSEARFQPINSDIKFINITALVSALSREQFADKLIRSPILIGTCKINTLNEVRIDVGIYQFG
jgi:hypothetical protein